ncbi:outer membrane beta-barrel protein [Helicobacter cetorum]|uniref:outer membrane beta-barrel protein n=1 Tax=Helicobacter cetorum TaxID=138563 RepID=UPI001F26C67F|nr:outer membrane beta-barrel protein [Helicobacter cetorum]
MPLSLNVLKAHEKSGFFIEGGFESGMLQGIEKREQQIITEHKIYEDYLPLDTILKGATNLFTTPSEIAKLSFSALHPIKVSVSNGNLILENFLPYNLNNVKLTFKDSQGNVINLGMIETIPKGSKIVLPEKLFENFKDISSNATYTDFEVSSTKFSDANTQRLFKVLEMMTTDLKVFYPEKPPFDSCQYTGKPPKGRKGTNTCYTPFNAQNAEEFTNLLINMFAVLDSKSWKENILNAPFQFTNSPKNGNLACMPKNRATQCVAPDVNGLVPTTAPQTYTVGKGKQQKEVSIFISPEKVVETFQSNMNLKVSILKGAGVQGLGSGSVTNGRLSVAIYALDPQQLFGKDLKTINKGDLGTILHEFGHTKSYSHNGNMTYGNVPVAKGQPSVYNVCSRFGGENQPTYPGNFQGSVYPDCNNVPGGFVDLTMKVWQQLINQNALPIDYANLSSQKNYSLNASLNTSDLANSMLNTLKESFLVSNMITTSSSSSSQRFNVAMLGANLKLGYQQYFNDYLGLAYYGIAKYNFSSLNGSSNNKVQQMSFGLGVDLLLDFITHYDNKKPLRSQLVPKRLFKSSFGMFMGLRGLYNNYYLFKQYHNKGNLNIVGGLNYRYKHSKYSVGISVPLIEQVIRVSLRDNNIQSTWAFKEGASHFNVFFNYGWVF